MQRKHLVPTSLTGKFLNILDMKRFTRCDFISKKIILVKTLFCRLEITRVTR